MVDVFINRNIWTYIDIYRKESHVMKDTEIGTIQRWDVEGNPKNEIWGFKWSFFQTHLSLSFSFIFVFNIKAHKGSTLAQPDIIRREKLLSLTPPLQIMYAHSIRKHCLPKCHDAIFPLCLYILSSLLGFFLKKFLLVF